MMTAGELEKIPLPFQKHMSELEVRIMSEIVRAIKINGFSTATADGQMKIMLQLGRSEKEIKDWVKSALDATDKELELIFSDEVYKEYYGYARAYDALGVPQIPFEDNVELQSLIDATRQQTKKTFRNMTNSMGFAIRDPVTGKITHSPLMEFYQNTLDSAMMDLAAGAASYDKVLTRTINTMTNSGLRWIDYDSGWHNRVDVAARRAVMTGFRQVQGKINEQVAKDLDTDRFEVTYHIGARPTHQPWQGRVHTYEQLESVCGLGSITGLHGANCHHDYNAFIPGISVRTYTDAQLDEMIAEENTPKDYYGKQYTTYEALQQQRKMETAMRKTRQDIKLMQEGEADKQSIILKQAKYRGQMQQYKDFSNKMGLPEQRARVYQDGLGKLPKRVVKPRENGIINTKIHSSIRQRNTGKGNPNAILLFDVSLNRRQERILSQLTGYDDSAIFDKSDISMKDLSALTAKTGDEFAMFTIGGKRLIIRGDSSSVNVDLKRARELADQGFKFSGHTHPGIDTNCLLASGDDYEILKVFNQKQSVTYNSKGQFMTYELE